MADDYTKFLKPAGDTVAGAVTAIYPASAGGIDRLGSGLSGLLGAAGVSLGEDPKPPEKTEAKKFDGFGFEPRRAKPQQNLPPPPPLSLDDLPTPPDAQTLAPVPPESTASPESASDRDAVAALLSRRGWSAAEVAKILAGPATTDPADMPQPAQRVQALPATRVKVEEGTAETGATALSALRLAGRLFGGS